MSFASEEPIECNENKHIELGQKKRTLYPRNTRDISFNSIQEGDKNSTSSYIQHTLLAGKTSDLSLASVEPIECTVNFLTREELFLVAQQATCG
ncbi:hypothetical protein STEG23_018488 [Scotinomys teguina]